MIQKLRIKNKKLKEESLSNKISKKETLKKEFRISKLHERRKRLKEKSLNYENQKQDQ